MKPPEKLSDLIRLAVADCKSCVRAGLWLNMGAIRTSCSVCLAGATLLNQQAATVLQACYPEPKELLDGWEIRHISALDWVRQGQLDQAYLAYYGKRLPRESLRRGYHAQIDDVEQFYGDMHEYANVIESYENQ